MKKWLLAAVFFILSGGLILVAVLANNEWNFSKFDEGKYEVKTYEANGDFQNIRLELYTDDVAFARSADDTCRVACTEGKWYKYAVTVEDGTLCVKYEETRKQKWWEYIHFGFSAFDKKVTVYLPKTEYEVLKVNITTGNLKVPAEFSFTEATVEGRTGNISFYAGVREKLQLKNSTGNITVEGIQPKSALFATTTGNINGEGLTVEEDLTVSVSTGYVTLKDVTCKKLESKGNTGKFSASAINVAQTANVKRSTGNLVLEGGRAGELVLETSSGSITVSNFDCDGKITARFITGRAGLTNVNCAACEVNGKTGDSVFKNFLANGLLSVTETTGNVKLDASDAGELLIKTGSGNVTGTLRTEKIFLTSTGTGKIDVPKTVNGGKCDITTKTGNIKISLQ